VIGRLVKLVLCVSFVFFVGLLFVGQSHAKIDAKSIVGIWLFDDGTGKTAKDSSGNKHDGVVKGDLKWVDGKFGKAIEFPGVNDNFVEVPHDDSLNLTTFSFTAWVKIQSTGGYQSILIKTADGAVENYSGYLMDSSSVFWTRFTSGGAGKWAFQKWGATKVADDKWHHLAGTYDMKSVVSYTDGGVEAAADTNGKPDASPGPLNIGDCPAYPYAVKGIMDDVGLFNVGLTADDIKTIMDKGLATFLAVSPSGKLATKWGEIKDIR
jgi:hypothetical protein